MNTNRNLEIFEAANPEIAAWFAESYTYSDFAVSLRNQVMTKGFLSERQMAAAQSSAEKMRARQAAKANAPVVKVDVTYIEKAFAKGQDSGLTRPKMRLMGVDGEAYNVSMAPAHGRNAGALYVKRIGDDAYMGKILAGAFTRVSACSDAAEAAIVDACANPERSAVAYGRAFGSCSCCGRTLTNELSIELGIGPICRSNFF